MQFSSSDFSALKFPLFLIFLRENFQMMIFIKVQSGSFTLYFWLVSEAFLKISVSLMVVALWLRQTSVL